MAKGIVIEVIAGLRKGKAAYIISMYHFAPNQNQLEWIGMISEGQRDIKSSKAGSGRTLFNKVFIQPWNALFKDDVITFTEE